MSEKLISSIQRRKWGAQNIYVQRNESAGASDSVAVNVMDNIIEVFLIIQKEKWKRSYTCVYNWMRRYLWLLLRVQQKSPLFCTLFSFIQYCVFESCCFDGEFFENCAQVYAMCIFMLLILYKSNINIFAVVAVVSAVFLLFFQDRKVVDVVQSSFYYIKFNINWIINS